MSGWVPLVDVSEHQGATDFRTMRAKGVMFLILRISHGQTKDARVSTYYRDALSAGYKPANIGFYSFINPKRGSGVETATTTANYIKGITGRTDVLYMLDVENYAGQTPSVGLSPVSGVAFSTYLKDHISAFKKAMPGCRVIGYTNKAYWDSGMGPQDPNLAAQIEWICPRYPIATAAGYQSKGYPPTPGLWDEYALKLQPAGPIPPNGGKWLGWQFSAEYNLQGSVYGCSSSNLDLNIVDAQAAARWFFSPDPVPPIQIKEPDVLIPHNGVRLAGGQVTVKADTPTKIAVAPGTPQEATGVAVNITFTGSLLAGYASLWSGEGAQPEISQVNWKAGTDVRNSFTVSRIINGEFTVQATEEVNLIFDQVGFTQPPIAGPQGIPGPQGQPGAQGPPGDGGTMTDEEIAAAVVRELQS